MPDPRPSTPDPPRGPHAAPPGPRERMAALLARYERVRSRWQPPGRRPAAAESPAQPAR
jgi:hypothetical protein